MVENERPMPQFHGDDEQAAHARAKEIEGRVVWSWKRLAPDAVDVRLAGEVVWGYWSEPVLGGMWLRLGERLIHDYSRFAREVTQ